MAPISVIIDGNTAQEVIDQMVRFVGVLPPPAPAPEVPAAENNQTEEAAKPKGRPRKYGAEAKAHVQAQIEAAKAQEEALQPKPEPAPAPAEPAKEATLELVRKTLQDYSSKHGGGTDGMAKVAELLKSFDAKRISEVKKEDYQRIIDACNTQ